jgi:hypothetical protein
MAITYFSNQRVIKGQIRYVNEMFPNGWLTVLINGTRRDILEGTKVRMIEEKDGREYFTILEGKYKGKRASVLKKQFLGFKTSFSHLTTKNKQIKIPGKVVFYIDQKKIYIKGLGTFNAITLPQNPIRKGTYFLQIPDEIHGKGSPYLSYSQYAKTWFRIGESGDRYFHCGSISAGCITVTDLAEWTKIYKYFRFRRNVFFGKTTGVGFVEVK